MVAMLRRLQATRTRSSARTLQVLPGQTVKADRQGREENVHRAISGKPEVGLLPRIAFPDEGYNAKCWCA